MGKPVLLLRLEGPLQSWGARSRWDVRDTQPEPTKSGVVGLLACALGIGRGDPALEELDQGLLFGVRVEAPGRVRQDYQTISDYLPTADGRYKHSGIAVGASLSKLRADADTEPATIVSPRYYLEDAAFLVALEAASGTPEMLLSRCAAAVADPVWPLYLGRKACVASRPILDELTDGYDGIEDALRRHTWSWLGGAANESPARLRQRDRVWEGNPAREVYDGDARLDAYVEDRTGLGQPRQDAIRVNTARLYGFRIARALVEPPIRLRDVLPVALRPVTTEEK